MAYDAFTTTADRIANRIITKVSICAAVSLQDNPEHLIAHEFTALWDTGASRSMISPRVSEKCGLELMTYSTIGTAGEAIQNAPTYLIDVILPHPSNPRIADILAAEGIHNAPGFDILIGMDIISVGDFAISNHNGRSTFSFRWPSYEKIDFTQQHKSLTKKRRKKKPKAKFAKRKK